jgi:uncharacterized protein YceK
MTLRLLALLVLLAAAFLTSGCASMEESSDDQMNTYHAAPDSPSDDHGWGANLQGMNNHQ